MEQKNVFPTLGRTANPVPTSWHRHMQPEFLRQAPGASFSKRTSTNTAKSCKEGTAGKLTANDVFQCRLPTRLWVARCRGDRQRQIKSSRDQKSQVDEAQQPQEK